MLAQGKISGPERQVVLPTGPTHSGCKGAVSMSEQHTLPALPEQDGVEFRYVPGFPGYAVGDNGSVWSCWKRTSGGRGGMKPRVMSCNWSELSPVVSKQHRRTVHLCRDGSVFSRFVHRLVLEAFVGPCPEGMECCHFPDSTPSNNALSNLRWDTKQSNMADKVIHGTDPSGTRNPRAKLIPAHVQEIIALAAQGCAQSKIAKMYGVSKASIWYILKGETWKSAR
jgi:hypothetical protein